ncbi:MAG: GTPase HflX [Erysipelotrichaceae bacterium]|nr:GTPase HflX [Erysipelotrichaceae bacterium]
MLEKGIIVGVKLPETNQIDQQMAELEQLCYACEIDVVASFIQNLTEINRTYYIGSGKAHEIKEAAKEKEASVIIFLSELTASHYHHLETLFQLPVFDRTDLILQIFQQRAKTREAKIQVEIAQLQYALPRLKGSSTAYDRQYGGVRNKGLGETKLELNKRRIESRIQRLTKELQSIENHRKAQSHKREKSPIPKVALVGYTNAGKSSVMNALLKFSSAKSDKFVYEENMLFATLDTNTRYLSADKYPPFLLSDTVGFVSSLPHHLIKAFRSTLLEVREADLLLHIVDRSDDHYEEKMEITENTLKQIDAFSIPILTVYNKIDLCQDMMETKQLCISARYDQGIDALLQAITDILFKDDQRMQIIISYEDVSTFTHLIKTQFIYHINHTDKGYEVDFLCPYEQIKKYESYRS